MMPKALFLWGDGTRVELSVDQAVRRVKLARQKRRSTLKHLRTIAPVELAVYPFVRQRRLDDGTWVYVPDEEG